MNLLRKLGIGSILRGQLIRVVIIARSGYIVNHQITSPLDENQQKLHAQFYRLASAVLP
jgi:hypothetical protein